MIRDLWQPSHLLILAVIVAVLFGGKRLPEAARGLGRSMRIFKSEIKQLNDDTPTPPPAPQQPQAPLEGRIMDGGDATGRAGTPTEQRRDA